MDPHSRAPKKDTSHGNDVLAQDTTHLIQNFFFTNEELRANIQQAIGPHKDLTIVKRRKLQWYGHVSHLSGLAKTILQGTVKGERKQSRQRKRWEDNIRKKTSQTEEEVGRQHQGMDRPGVRQVPKGSGEQEKNEENWLRNQLWCPNDPRG